MKKRFRVFVKGSLVLVYLVIAAGAIVRMTGSGMGCPDWPKCFGYLIPPTEREQLDWHPHQTYHKGEVIIVEESLRVANQDFISDTNYNPSHWEAYTKHDYAHFDVYHTWIEFINRLLGALAGLATLLLLISALLQWSKSKRLTLVALLIVLGMGFQAWLGKTVVDSNLLPFKITLHMGMALLIVALLIYLLEYTATKTIEWPKIKGFKTLSLLGFVLTLAQILMGTQVRQHIDIKMEAFDPSLWLATPPAIFYLHRSFSLLILILYLYLGYKISQAGAIPKVFQWILGMLGISIVTGIFMYYFDFPFSSQPLHLILASLLFGAQLYFILSIVKKPST